MALGNSLTGDDGCPDSRFDYILANPPYGVDWKALRRPDPRRSRQQRGFDGPVRRRAAARLRRVAAVPAAHAVAR